MRDNRKDREAAREYLTGLAERQRKMLAKLEEEAKLPPLMRRHFSSIDPQVFIDFAEFRLRFLDCAPDGARHQVAPMQDKQGESMGGCWNENVLRTY